MSRRKYFLVDQTLLYEAMAEKAAEKGFEISGKKRKYISDSSGEKHLIHLEDGIVVGFSTKSYERAVIEDTAPKIKNKKVGKTYYQKVTEIGRFFEQDLGCLIARTERLALGNPSSKFDFVPDDVSSSPPLEIELDTDASLDEYDDINFGKFVGRTDDIYRLYVEKKLPTFEIDLSVDEVEAIVQKCVDREIKAWSKVLAAMRAATDKNEPVLLQWMIDEISIFKSYTHYEQLKSFIENTVKWVQIPECDREDFVLQISLDIRKQDKALVPFILAVVEKILPKLYDTHLKFFEDS